MIDTRVQSAPVALRTPAARTEKVAPLDVYPVQEDSLVTNGGWAGINKPIKVSDGDGNVFVAKSNTLGAFIGLHPDHDTRKENVREIVASHIMADELGLTSLTFQEGTLVAGDNRVPKVLSPLRSDFQTLEHADLKDIKDPAQAVALTITDGFLGNWDATFNDSNVWLRNDGQLMGSDYGYSLEPGIETNGIPHANLKIMKNFATKENVLAITDELKSWSDEKIHGMVERQGSKWISDWNPQMEAEFAGAIIANRDALREDNPYLKHVEGFQPGLSSPILKAKYPVFFFNASKAQWPPLNRPDQYLDIFGAVAGHFHKPAIQNFIHKMREHVLSPEEKAARAAQEQK